MDHFTTHSLAELIEQRIGELGITKFELLRRLGYQNVDKGFRRLETLFRYGVLPTGWTASHLAKALSIKTSVVDDARIELLRQISEADATRRTAERTVFRPYATILTTQSLPSQITLYGISGGDKRWRTIPLPQVPLRVMVRMVQDAIPGKLHNGVVPFFGRPTGFRIAYTPDRTLTFSLEGSLLKLERTQNPSTASVTLNGKQVWPTVEQQ